jgi:hypothetical protein
MNYKIPVDFYSFFQKAELSQNKKKARFDPIFEGVDRLKDSIDNFIELLVFTFPGECSFLPDFGFPLWENRFKNISITQFNESEFPRKEIEEGLLKSINEYETRLQNIKVEVILMDDESSQFSGKYLYTVKVTVAGTIKTSTAEPYRKTIYFSSETMTKK